MVSEPPRPSVVTSSESCETPWKPATSTIFPVSSAVADAVSLHLEDARLGVAGVGHDPRLRAGERDRLAAEIVDHHRRERAGHPLPGRQQHVHLARVWALGHLVGLRHQLVGVLAARRQHRHHVVALGGALHDPPGGALDALRVGHRGAAELHDNRLGHGGTAKASVRPVQQRPRLTLAVLAGLALGALVFGVVVGAGRDGEEEPAPGAVPERAGRSLDRTSFLARVVPPAERRERQARGPNVPRSVADLAKRLPLERKVAQLFLFGFRGADLNAEIFRRLRRLDLGGIVVGTANYTRSVAARPARGRGDRDLARREARAPLGADRPGRRRVQLAARPAARVPRRRTSARPPRRAQLATETAKTLRGLNVTGVLGPVVDVGLPSGSALGARVYSDEPDEVAALRRRRGHRLPRRAAVRRGPPLPRPRRRRPVHRAGAGQRGARPRGAARARPDRLPAPRSKPACPAS